MSSGPISVRDDLADVVPYESPQRRARHRMNTNESPYPPPEGVLDSVASSLRELALNRYPDSDASVLHDALSEHLGWSRDGLWLANGSNEVLLHLFLAFGGPRRLAMTFEPTYSLHTLIPRITLTRVRDLWRAEDFRVDLGDALEALEEYEPDIVVLCSPNNPTGNCEPLDTVRALLQLAKGIVIVDEAYGEFAGESESVRSLMDGYRNLVMVRTFSKAWSLAGVRLGYMLCDPSLREGLERVRLPYHLSTLTQSVGAAALRHASETARAIESIAAERDRISVELQAMGVKSFGSRANFVLFQVEDPEAVWSGLLEHGVLVRGYGDTPGLRGCLRVTAGLPVDTDAFLEAMRKVLHE